MYLSTKHRFLFIHIEKAAGSSVRDSLAPYWDKPCLADQILRRLRLPHRGWRAQIVWPLHFLARDARATLPDWLWESTFKFTFVRNPWDREFSTYRFYKSLLKTHPDDPRAIAANRYDDFETWFYEWRQGRPVKQQCDYLMNEDKRFLLDFHGRFEQINADWELIQQRIGIEVPLLRRNVVRPLGTRDQNGYQEHYSEQLREDVGKRYAMDVERLGYSFDNATIPPNEPIG